jgi:hypothetical protein
MTKNTSVLFRIYDTCKENIFLSFMKINKLMAAIHVTFYLLKCTDWKKR